jgi:hypothetical protein
MNIQEIERRATNVYIFSMLMGNGHLCSLRHKHRFITRMSQCSMPDFLENLGDSYLG